MPFKSGADKEDEDTSPELTKSVKVNLLEKDRNTILSNGCLGDNVINESQNILKEAISEHWWLARYAAVPNILNCCFGRISSNSPHWKKSLGLFNVDQWTFSGLRQFVQEEAYVIDGNEGDWMLSNLGHGQDPCSGTTACTNTTGRDGLWLVFHSQCIRAGSWKWPVGCFFWPRENAQAFSSMFGERPFWTFSTTVEHC